MDDLKDSSTPASRQAAFREDFWTEETTSTLVNAWGRRYLDLNRGNLRQKDWQVVANAVNSRHGHTEKTRRSDVQCKNRIDTLKKKYKVEKARITESNGTLMSPWPFYPQLEMLIGSNGNKHPNRLTPSDTHTPLPSSSQHSPPLPPLAVPLSYGKPVILPMKRPMLVPSPHESHFKKNYSAMAAAAAAVEEESKEDDSELEGEEAKGGVGRAAAGGGEGGMRRLAKAIERFGQIFERVENMKQCQMLELEKQRMQFANELEVQRMQLFMDAQIQLEKIKHSK